MKQIEIPQYLWLHPHLYDYKQFTLNDIRDIYNSPLTLIQDFEKIPGFAFLPVIGFVAVWLLLEQLATINNIVILIIFLNMYKSLH